MLCLAIFLWEVEEWDDLWEYLFEVTMCGYMINDNSKKNIVTAAEQLEQNSEEEE